MDFEDWQQQNNKLKDVNEFDSWQSENLSSQITAVDEYSEMEDIAKASQEFNIPLSDLPSIGAASERSFFTKALRSVREFVQDKTGMWEYSIAPIGQQYREETPVRTGLKIGAFYTANYLNGLSATVLDVITNKTKGDKTFADSIARIMGFDPTDAERGRGEALQYVGVFKPVGGAVKGATNLIPKKQLANKALKTILDAGLTFASVEAATEFSKNITEGKEVDWSQIHAAGGVGVLWGTGEVVVEAALTGLIKQMDKYWGEKGMEVAEKLRPPGTSLKDQYAKQQAEIVADIKAYKASKDPVFRQKIRDKYHGTNVPKDSAFAKPETVKTGTKPQSIQVAGASQPTISEPPKSANVPADITDINKSGGIFISKEEKDILRESGYSLSQILNMNPSEAKNLAKEVQNIKSHNEGGFLSLPFETPSPEQLKEGAEKIYQDTINRFASIENITKKAEKLGMEIKPGENPTLRAREYLGIGRKVESVLQNKTYKINSDGKIEITGEGLKPILDDYDNNIKQYESNKSQREQDWQDYLTSKRTVDDLQRPSRPGGENIVTPEQVAEAQDRINSLIEKYGPEGYAQIQEHSQRLYDYQKRVLELLVDSGVLSNNRFQDILQKNPHYVPFDRVMEDIVSPGVPKSKNRFSEAKSPIKKIKGSEREIENVTESIIKNTYRIMEVAERNTVAASVAKLGKVLPDDIIPVSVKMVPIKVDPKEILTISKTFSSQSSKVVEEIKNIQSENGNSADITGPVKKLEKVVKDALTHRGFSEGEAQSFINQIRKGKDSVEAQDKIIETIQRTIKETQQIIISEEPVESTIFRPSQFKPTGQVIEYYVDGKKKFIEVPKNLYEAMTGLNETGADMFAKILGMPAHWLRVGATITPEFITRNPIRDQFSASMQTSFGFVPFYDSIGAIADILKKKDIYYDWLRSGGAYSGFVELSRPALKKAVKELTSTKFRKALSKLNIITDLEDLSMLFEQATRLGVYKRAIASGMTPVEAGFQSREATTDFSRRGAKMTNVNRVIPFFNAGLQGIDKSIRNAINAPISTTAKAIAAITVPTVLLYLVNRRNEDYKEIPRWRRDLFWNFKINDIWFMLPKPFLYGQIFGSIPERFMEYLDTKDPDSFRDLENSVLDSVSPISGDQIGGLLPTAIKPFIENESGPGGWNYFLQREIVPEYRQELVPSEQFSRYTSKTSKELGKILNYSPAKIDNIISAYFGGGGRYITQGSDFLINSIKGETDPKRPVELSDIPLVKGFVQRNPIGPQAQSIQNFYEDSDKIIAAYNTIKQYFKDMDSEQIAKSITGDSIDKDIPEDVINLIKKQKNWHIAPDLLKLRKGMSDNSKQIDIIIKSNLTDEQKRKQLMELDKLRLDIARYGLQLMKEKP